MQNGGIMIDRIKRRIYTRKNLDLFLREMTYHRNHREAQNRSTPISVWRWGSEQGETSI